MIINQKTTIRGKFKDLTKLELRQQTGKSKISHVNLTRGESICAMNYMIGYWSISAKELGFKS